MKNLIITTALLLTTCFFSYGQQYYQVPALNKFAGTWQYSQGNESFKIILKVKKVFFKGFNLYTDNLEGGYLYTVDNTIKQNTLNTEKPGLSGGSLADKEKSVTKVHFLFPDPVKVKNGDLFFEISPTDPNVATWTLRNTEGLRVGPYDHAFSVPLKMTFKRVTTQTEN